jgi:hypothetical protein
MLSGWISLSGDPYGAINMGQVRAIAVESAGECAGDNRAVRVIFDANHTKTLKGEDAKRVLDWVRHFSE